MTIRTQLFNLKHSGLLPVALQLLLLATILSVLQWLHGVQWALYSSWFFFVAMLACVGVWLATLVVGEHSADERWKCTVALRLALLLAFAFSMTFIMIFMYYWLNEDGHVHGATGGASTIAEGERVVGPGGDVQVFTDVHVRGYKLPLKVQLSQTRLLLSSGHKQSLTLTLVNESSQSLPLRLSAKLAPSTAKPFVHYALLHHDQTLILAPLQTREITFELDVDAILPQALQPFTLAHFVFGADDQSAWEKMQRPLTLQPAS